MTKNNAFFLLLLLSILLLVIGDCSSSRNDWPLPGLTKNAARRPAKKAIAFVSYLTVTTNTNPTQRREKTRGRESQYSGSFVGNHGRFSSSSSSSSSVPFFPSSIIPRINRSCSSHNILLLANNNNNNEETTTTSTTKNKSTTAKRRTWDESYELLVEYYKEYGDSNVPQKYKKDSKLGKWVENQRNRKNRLSVDKTAKLDALNFIWDGEVAKKLFGDKKWEEMFQELVQYKKENGHCNVSKQNEDNKELGYWVQTQRRSYTNSVPSLTPYRIKKLESIGFVWRLKPFRTLQSDIWDEQWDEKFEELVMYKKEHGHCNVPRDYEPSKPLAVWVETQRSMNAGTHPGGAVRSDRKKRLEEIGFDWDFEQIYDEAWLSIYNQLMELKNVFEENSLDRQTWSSRADQTELWNWEIYQQNLYTRGKLDPQREAMLEEIGYWKSVGLKRETTQTSQ